MVRENERVAEYLRYLKSEIDGVRSSLQAKGGEQNEGLPVAVKDGTDATVVQDSLSYSITSAIIDDFNDGDVSEYSLDTGFASVVTSTGGEVFEGSHAVEFDGSPGSSTLKQIHSVSGLSNYPQPGDVFQIRHWPSSSTKNIKLGINYGFTDETTDNFSGYGIKIDVSNGKLQAWKVTNGSYDRKLNGTATFNYNAWNIIKVDWGGGGTHTITSIDSNGNSSSGSFTDSEYTGKGVGPSIFTGTGPDVTCYFDLIELL